MKGKKSEATMPARECLLNVRDYRVNNWTVAMAGSKRKKKFFTNKRLRDHKSEKKKKTSYDIFFLNHTDKSKSVLKLCSFAYAK